MLASWTLESSALSSPQTEQRNERDRKGRDRLYFAKVCLVLFFSASCGLGMEIGGEKIQRHEASGKSFSFASNVFLLFCYYLTKRRKLSTRRKNVSSFPMPTLLHACRKEFGDFTDGSLLISLGLCEERNWIGDWNAREVVGD